MRLPSVCFWDSRPETYILRNRAQCIPKLVLPKGCEHLDTKRFRHGRTASPCSRHVLRGHESRGPSGLEGSPPKRKNGRCADAWKRAQIRFSLPKRSWRRPARRLSAPPFHIARKQGSAQCPERKHGDSEIGSWLFYETLKQLGITEEDFRKHSG
jgi:hypothetical protein